MQPRTIEGTIMQSAKVGDIFYTTKSDRHVTAIAANYHRIVKTVKLITVNPWNGEPSAATITQVTIIE
jgi:hypothetical protein